MPQDTNKTNSHPSGELTELRQRNIELETSLAHLKEAEENIRAVSETALDAVIISDQDGNIVFWNKIATEIFGYEKEEVIGNPITMLISDEAMGEYTEGKEHVVERGVSLFGKRPKESVAKRKDGTKFPAEFTVSNWKVQDKYYFGGSMRDISEQKRAEEELIKTKDFLENIYNTTPDVLTVSDEKGYVIGVNKAAEKMLGFSQKELIGKHTSELFPKDEKHAQIGSKMITELREKGFIKSLEANWVRKDGSLCPVELNITVLQDRDGKRVGAVAAIRDFTERKQHEEVLRESEERFRTIAESSTDAIITADSSGKILYCNKSVERIYGYTAEELVGKSIEVLESATMRSISRKKRKDFVKAGLAPYIERTVEGKGIRKDGSEVPVEVSQSHWKIGGNIIFGGIIRDITKRKQLEEELRKSHAELEKKVKQRTAALREANDKLKISQTYLKTFAGMLLSAREEERKNIATTIHDELGSMAIAVDSQISIAKEECNDNNKQATFKALTNAQAALRKAVEDLRKVAVDLRPANLEIMGLNEALTDLIDKVKEQAKLKIIFTNESGTKKIPEDRAIAIYRVIQEALTNISKHAKAQKVSVRLYSDKNKVHLEITDDGVGFDVDNISKSKGKLKIGIEGMRERIESLGGEFMINSAFKEGTQLKATLHL